MMSGQANLGFDVIDRLIGPVCNPKVPKLIMKWRTVDIMRWWDKLYFKVNMVRC